MSGKTFQPNVPTGVNTYLWSTQVGSNFVNFMPPSLPTTGDVLTFNTPIAYTSVDDASNAQTQATALQEIRIPPLVTLDLQTPLYTHLLDGGSGNLISSVNNTTNKLFVIDDQTGSIGTINGTNGSMANKATITFLGNLLNVFAFTASDVNIEVNGNYAAQQSISQLNVTRGDITIQQNLTGGSIILSCGVLKIFGNQQQITSAINITLQGGAVQYVTPGAGTLSNGGTVNLNTGNGGTLVFDKLGTYAYSGLQGVVMNTSPGGGALLFKDQGTGNTPYKYNYSGNTLTILNSANNVLYQITPATLTTDGSTRIPSTGTLSSTTFTDSTGATSTYYYLGTITPFCCFLKGSKILTPNGEIAIEKLNVDDEILTFKDNNVITKKIEWIGHADINVFGVGSKNAPIRIKKSAIEHNVPNEDLLVSPGHAIYIDGKLIHALELVNGLSIYQDKTFTDITYYHIKLDKHSIINAQGLLCESYFDVFAEHRKLFDNGNEITVPPLKQLMNNRNITYIMNTQSAAPLLMFEPEKIKKYQILLKNRAQSINFESE